MTTHTPIFNLLDMGILGGLKPPPLSATLGAYGSVDFLKGFLMNLIFDIKVCIISQFKLVASH